MKDPVLGTATVSDWKAVTEPGLVGMQRPGWEVTLEAQVVVQADGLEPTAVEWITNFPQSELPLHAGSVIPVTVDRRNPKHLKLAPGFAKRAKHAAEEAEVAQGEQRRDQAQRLAASLDDGKSQTASLASASGAGLTRRCDPDRDVEGHGG